MKVKPDRPPPPFLKLGAGAHYTRLDVLADLMATSEEGIRTLLGALGLPIAHFPGMGPSKYVLTYAFESAMFELGLPTRIKERPDLVRVHQELAGVMYNVLTKEALRERVVQLARALTSAGDKATIGRKSDRVRKGRTWTGRKPSD